MLCKQSVTGAKDWLVLSQLDNSLGAALHTLPLLLSTCVRLLALTNTQRRSNTHMDTHARLQSPVACADPLLRDLRPASLASIALWVYSAAGVDAVAHRRACCRLLMQQNSNNRTFTNAHEPCHCVVCAQSLQCENSGRHKRAHATGNSLRVQMHRHSGNARMHA